MKKKMFSKTHVSRENYLLTDKRITLRGVYNIIVLSHILKSIQLLYTNKYRATI